MTVFDAGVEARRVGPIRSSPVLEALPKPRRAGSRIEGGLVTKTMVGRCAAAVVLFSAFVSALTLAGTSGAGADQIQSTQEQIAALEAQVQAGAEQIHQLTTEFDQAQVEASTLQQEVAGDQTELSRLETKVDANEALIRQEALFSYTGGVTTDPGLPVSGATDPAVRAEYLQVATGDIGDTVDQYQLDRQQVAAAEHALAAQERASEAAATTAASARTAAEAQAGTEQSQLNQLQGRLEQLVEAAAVEAAAAARPAPGPAAPPTQGLPVDGGLVAVVHSIVSPPPPPAPPPAAPPPPYTGSGGVWLELRECESSDNYQANTGNGYYGAYQFSQSTWTGLGYPGRPDLEPPAMQDQAAMRAEAEYGWGQWPACAAALGL